MRFKIYYNEAGSKLDINCLPDKHLDVILPENPDQHVYFPIPNNLSAEVKEFISTLISNEEHRIFEEYREEIKVLTDKRRKKMNELRLKLNPQIIEKCHQFRQKHAELFI